MSRLPVLISTATIAAILSLGLVLPVKAGSAPIKLYSQGEGGLRLVGTYNTEDEAAAKADELRQLGVTIGCIYSGSPGVLAICPTRMSQVLSDLQIAAADGAGQPVDVRGSGRFPGELS